MIRLSIESENLFIENNIVYVDEHTKEYGELIQAVIDSYSPTYEPDYEDGLGQYIIQQLKYLTISFEVLGENLEMGDKIY